jgi:TolA-binding protein
MEPVNELERLGRLAAESQDARLDELVDLDVARRRFAATPPKPRVTARVTVVAGVVIGLAAAMALFVMGGNRQAASLTFRVGDSHRVGNVDAWLEAPREKALPLRFSDGTEVRLEPRARARVTRLEATGATVNMESGRANVAVAKRKGAAWRVAVGPFVIEVTGTRFDVDWDAANDSLALRMHEGSVTVSGCVFGQGRAIVAGETVRASCREPQLEISRRATIPADGKKEPAATGVDGDRAQPSKGVESPASGASSAHPETHPEPRAKDAITTSKGAVDWRELARNGRHSAAVDVAEATGFAAQCAQASAEDLVALGDAARYSGRLARAMEAYRAVRERFPGHERSAVAAFALGRIAFDQQRDYAGAARWFRAYISEQPGGRLDRDASGRLMESLSRAGDTAGARAEAKRYLERYPDGPHAEMARRLVAE